MKIATPTQLDPDATIGVLRATQAQIIRQGDDYTGERAGAGVDDVDANLQARRRERAELDQLVQPGGGEHELADVVLNLGI
jgi:hypothetical protein